MTNGRHRLRLVQVSDTHLSRRQAFFVGNFLKVVDAVNRLRPDLIVHTGDLSINGVEVEDDLVFAAAAHRLFDAPVLFVPGNHDVGEEPGFAMLDQPATAARIARFRRLVGPDRWVERLGEWRLFGLNSQLVGTGLQGEAEQLDWFATELGREPWRPTAVFLHKPLFFPRRIAGGRPEALWIPAALRGRLLSLMLRHRVAVIGSGHLHKALDVSVAGTRVVWAPATAYRSGRIVGSGSPMLGFLLLELDGVGPRVRTLSPPGLVDWRLGPLLGDQVYLKDAPETPPALARSVSERLTQRAAGA